QVLPRPPGARLPPGVRDQVRRPAGVDLQPAPRLPARARRELRRIGAARAVPPDRRQLERVHHHARHDRWGYSLPRRPQLPLCALRGQRLPLGLARLRADRVPAAVESWNLNELQVEPHLPQVLDSESEGRAIVINLPKGEQLQEHQVHERAWVLVIDGLVGITTPDGDDAEGPAGLLASFDPAERHEVTALEDSRLLLVLSPWPGDGHPSNRTS